MIWTAQEAQAIDRLSSEAYGIPSLSLMNEAGQAIYRLALSLWKPYARFVVLAGGGGNGGDALVVARLLRLAGFDSSVFDVSGGKESPDRKAQRLAFEALGGRLLPFADGRDFQDLHGDLILIDGLTGLGLKGPLRPGLIASCLRAAGELRARDVLAIDLPSGMNADLWEQAAPNLAASHTMTFGALKPLHVGNPARKYCGVIHRAEIGFAPEAVNQVLAERSLSLDHYLRVERIPKLWEHLAADAHKFDRGHVLAIGGSPGKVGALLLAAEAAWQSGAGWVSVAPLSELLAPAWPREFTYESFALEGEIDETALVTFIRNRKVKGVLIGPGTMSSPLTPTLLRSLAELQKDSGLRLIFDAGL